MSCRSNLLTHCISIPLIIFLVTPKITWAKATSKTKGTVIMLSVGQNKNQLKSEHQIIISSIRNQLKNKLHILKFNSANQIGKLNQNITDPKLAEVLRLMNESLDGYSSYRAGPNKTIIAMDSVKSFLNENVKASPQASELMTTAIMTKSWMLYKSKEKNKSAIEINTIRNISNNADLQLSYYPPSFRRFVKKIPQRTHQNSYTLKIQSSPKSANVYINHVYVGVSPLSINLPSNNYKVGFYLDGRKPVTKKIKLTQNKSTSAHLVWEAKTNKKLVGLSDKWASLSQSKKTAFASQVSSASNADQAVFFNFVKTKAGIIPQATVYDAKFSQLLKTISYPKPVADITGQQKSVSSFFAKKLTPYLGKNSMSYWSKEIDKNMIVDHRIANKGMKPIYKKPVFWAVVGSAVLAGTITAIAVSQSGGSKKDTGTGGVTVSFNGL